MRVLTAAAILLLASGVAPSFAQEPLNSNQPQTVPVQPERSPQQSEQSRAQDRDRGEDVQLRRDWRVQQRDGERMGSTGQNESGRVLGQEQRTVGQDWRARRDNENYRGSGRADRDSAFSDEDRPRRRMKTCFEYENGDELCRYR